MSNVLDVFNYGDKPVRIISIAGEPWFVAADVCNSLELKNVTQAVAKLDDDERAMFNLGVPYGEVNIINESGLYSMTLNSRKPEAKKFKRWVTHDVLPAIRKTGSYNLNGNTLVISELSPSLQLIAQLVKEIDNSNSVVHNRIDGIEETVNETKSEVNDLKARVTGYLDPPNEWRKEIREKINEIVKLSGKQKAASYRKAWHSVYDKVKEVTGIDIRLLLDVEEHYSDNHDINDDIRKLDLIESIPIVRDAATKIVDNMLCSLKHKKLGTK